MLLDSCHMPTLAGTPYINTGIKVALLLPSREHTPKVRRTLTASLIQCFCTTKSGKKCWQCLLLMRQHPCFPLWSSLVQSARCHSKPEAVTDAVLLLCAALPQWIKISFPRPVKIAAFRRKQLKS